jgi:hypothetical protein
MSVIKESALVWIDLEARQHHRALFGGGNLAQRLVDLDRPAPVLLVPPLMSPVKMMTFIVLGSLPPVPRRGDPIR